MQAVVLTGVEVTPRRLILLGLGRTEAERESRPTWQNVSNWCGQAKGRCEFIFPGAFSISKQKRKPAGGRRILTVVVVRGWYLGPPRTPRSLQAEGRKGILGRGNSRAEPQRWLPAGSRGAGRGH